MKIMAITKDLPGVNWENSDEILKNETINAYKLYQDGIFREIYFTQNRDAVIILEALSIDEAVGIMNNLPLVQKNFISYELFELNPYNGFERLFENWVR